MEGGGRKTKGGSKEILFPDKRGIVPGFPLIKFSGILLNFMMSILPRWRFRLVLTQLLRQQKDGKNYVQHKNTQFGIFNNCNVAGDYAGCNVAT